MNHLKRINLQTYGRVAILFLVDLIFFGNTSASNVPAFLLIVGFILILATSYCVIYGLVCLLKLYGLPIKRKHSLSIAITVVFGILIALESVGELSSKDVLVILPLGTVSYAYVSYLKINRKTNK